MKLSARKVFDELQKASIAQGQTNADLVMDNADDDRDGWITWASGWLYRYAGSTDYFMVEDLVDYLVKSGSYMEPHDNRAWGGVTLAATNAGLIEHYGFSPSRVRHGSPTRVWRSKFKVENSLNDIQYFYDQSNTLVIS